MNPVRQTTKEIIENPKFVNIAPINVAHFAKKIINLELDTSKLDILGKLETDDRIKQLTFMILMHSNGFCFWNKETDRWRYTLKDGSTDKGQFAFLQAWLDYFNANPELFSFKHFADISYNDFIKVYQGGKNLYLLQERHEKVQKISQYFIETWNGNIEKFILSADHKIEALLPLITRNLYGFDDAAEYKGKKVYFWKLAQLFVYDLLANYQDDEVGVFDDVDSLTGLADYKLPQLFEAEGLMTYEKSLEDKILGGTIIGHGSQEEIEIRSAVVVLVDLVFEEIKKQGLDFNLYEVNNLIFLSAKSTKAEKPYHLSKNIYY